MGRGVLRVRRRAVPTRPQPVVGGMASRAAVSQPVGATDRTLPREAGWLAQPDTASGRPDDGRRSRHSRKATTDRFSAFQITPLTKAAW